MDNNITLNSIVFTKAFDAEGEGVRRSSARGVNTPDVMVIKSQSYVDKASGVAGNRYTLRFDRHELDAQGRAIVTSFYTVAAIPGSAPQASIDAVMATFKAGIADSGLLTAVLNSEK